MKNFLTTTLCYIIAITVVAGQRLLPVLITTVRFIWELMLEPEPAPALASVLPLPVTPVPPVKPAKTATVKTSTTSKPRTTRKRTTKPSLTTSKSTLPAA